MSNRIPRIRVEDAIARFGGTRPLAEFLGVTPSAVIMWRGRGKEFLPPLRAMQVVPEHPDLAQPPEPAVEPVGPA